MNNDALDLKWDWEFSTDGDYSKRFLQWLGRMSENYPPISIFEVPVVFEIKNISEKK